MTWRLDYSHDFLKFLKIHPEVSERVLQSFEIIAQNPYARDNHLDITKLSGVENRYRLRIGKYRYLYEVIDEAILVYAYKAEGRGDVYKKK